MEKFCIFDGCDRKFDSRGYCSTHAKMARDGLPLRPLRKRRRPHEMGNCEYPGCYRAYKSGGYCGAHYVQYKRGKGMKDVQVFRYECSVEGCDKGHSSKGYCADHYRIYNTFKLKPEDYEKVNEQQGGVCAICKNKCLTGYRLSVDHDHKTNLFRGLLCGKCNKGIGMFDDNVKLLESAISYLKTH